MSDLSAVLQLREGVCQRLRARPADAEAERHLLAWFGCRGDVERYVAERVCSLAAMLAMDTVPARHLQAYSQGGTLAAWALDAVAHTFAEEIAQLRIVLQAGVRQTLPGADAHVRQAELVRAFVTGTLVRADAHAHTRPARPPGEERG